MKILQRATRTSVRLCRKAAQTMLPEQNFLHNLCRSQKKLCWVLGCWAVFLAKVWILQATGSSGVRSWGSVCRRWNPQQEMLRRYYDAQNGSGFDYAYRLSRHEQGAQAAGGSSAHRRTGVWCFCWTTALPGRDYARLFPPHGSTSGICTARGAWAGTAGFLAEIAADKNHRLSDLLIDPAVVLFCLICDGPASFLVLQRLPGRHLAAQLFPHGIAVPVCLRRASKASSRYFISDTAFIAWSDAHKRPSGVFAITSTMAST